MTRANLVLIAATVCIGAAAYAQAQDANQLTVTTWNIEHLGSPGRGFGGGFGGGHDLPWRTPEQLKNIAKLIHDDLHSDVMAVQEIAITRRSSGASFCDPLDTIVAELKVLGQTWNYFLPPVAVTPAKDDIHNEHLGFVWNSKRARLLTVFELDLENQDLAGKGLFDRKPLIGYFEALDADGKSKNDFVLVNVHLASGQEFDENHLIAMTLIEHELSNALGRHAVKESDRIILGDFNDNPAAKNQDGTRKFTPALYLHMQHKGYVDLVTDDIGTTRVSDALNSLIDHILVNAAAKKNISQNKAEVFRFDGGTNETAKLTEWRINFSDHFPLSFQIKITADDDVDFFK